MTSKILRVSLMTAVCTLTIASAANAAGFYIQEQSVRGLGSAFSGSATTLDDASTIYFNPAGMTKLDGMQIQAGANLLIPNAKVKDNGSTVAAPAAASGIAVGGPSGNPYDPTPVPNGFFSYQLTDSLWAGVGVTAPFGLGSDYGNTWFGRFDSTKTELAVIDIQPTVAYKVNDWLSLGAGVNIAHSSADLRSRVIAAIPPVPTLVEGNSKLEGDDWGFGYSLGVQLKPLPETTVGISYKSEVHHTLDGKIVGTFLNGTPIPGQSSNGTAKLTTPDHVTIGVAHNVTDRLTLQGQAQWFGWNNFDNITAIRDSGVQASRVDQNYQTSWAFSLGAEYKVDDKWRVRGGLQFDETPTTDEYRTSRTPDGDRTWFSLGTTYSINEKLDLDVAGTYIDVDDGIINVNRNILSPATTTNMKAKTSGDVGIVAVGFKYKF